MNIDMSGVKGTARSFEFLASELRSKAIVGLIAAPDRIGVRSFTVFLEYRLFPPGSPLNADMEFILAVWAGMSWYILTFPKHRLAKADALLASLGLRRADGVPNVIMPDASGVPRRMRFPFDLPNVWTIENVAGHFVYRHDPATDRTAHQVEQEAIDREIEEFKARRA